MKPVLIKNALVINEGNSFKASILIEKETITAIFKENVPESVAESADIIDAEGKWLMPGVIDDHVHFRDPGLTHKGDMATESKAAVAGGVTSFMDMPNNVPQTTSIKAWEGKVEIARQKSYANYSFYLGATENNLEELERADYGRVCGVKVFMGSSTGNMLVDDSKTLERIFRSVPAIIAVHAESESIIKENKDKYVDEFGNDLPLSYHQLIRNEKACYEATARAIEIADRCGTRLHLLHLSTAKELNLLDDGLLEDKKITSEACILHLWFDEDDYDRYGNMIKCNPAIKTAEDRAALREGVASGLIDVVATDHAPHLWTEKAGGCLVAASGAPSVQFSLQVMLELVFQGLMSKEALVKRMCHAPAIIHNIVKRGFIREGYYADLVLVDPDATCTLSGSKILSKCGWSPFEGMLFHSDIYQTWVNGKLVYEKGKIKGRTAAKELMFAC